ncbi:MAG: hypothetical protein L3K15_05475 [Thermoplasmata archaeon]|nr:hypothetical protein [Thermoplasmata archaeon]
MQPASRIKSFATTAIGRTVLIALAIGTLVGAFLVLGPFISIPTLLLFGLALPIYMGEKRPKRLALWGLVILLLAAPLASVGYAANARMAPGPVNSLTTFPYSGNHSPVLQGAQVAPYLGKGGATFQFTVHVVPANLPYNQSKIAWVELFVGTCPGATTASSPYCTAGYPFYGPFNDTFGKNGTRLPQVAEFNVTLHGEQIWWWQMAAAAWNTTGGNITWIFLDPQTGYPGVEGPVTGDFFSTVSLVLPLVYEYILVYDGIPFYIALAVYALLKSRERRRKAAQGDPGSRPAADAASPSAPAPATRTPTPAPKPELSCPNCKAVVYPNEANCWKCGAPLKAGAPPTAPLASGPPS